MRVTNHHTFINSEILYLVIRIFEILGGTAAEQALNNLLFTFFWLTPEVGLVMESDLPGNLITPSLCQIGCKQQGFSIIAQTIGSLHDSVPTLFSSNLPSD